MLKYTYSLTVTDTGADLKGKTQITGDGKLDLQGLAAGTSLENVLTETLRRELSAAVDQLAENARPIIETAQERETDERQGNIFSESKE